MADRTRRRTHSPAVYRRRRLVVLLGFLVVVGLVVWLLVAQPWSGSATDDSPRVTPTPATSASVEPAPAATDDADVGENDADGADTDEAQTADAAAEDPVVTPDPTGTARPCVASALTVEAVTDQDTYSAGQNPELSIRLTNSGGDDCTLNVGTSTQAFTITSGNDVWWRSTDCQAEPSDMIVTLAAGQTVTSAAPLVWDRTRSNVSTCDAGDRPRAPGGGASYHLTVEIGGVASVGSRQFLLY